METGTTRRYTILETDSGPMISNSRVSIFDVMEAYDAGNSLYEISAIFNLTPLQVETALDYIARNRATLQPQLAEILRVLVEREAFYHKQAAEVDKRIAMRPLTPERAKLLELRESSRVSYGGNQDADRTE